MNAAYKALLLAEMQRRYPEAGEREWMLRIAVLSMPAELVEKAFGWQATSEDTDIDLDKYRREVETAEFALLKNFMACMI